MEVVQAWTQFSRKPKKQQPVILNMIMAWETK